MNVNMTQIQYDKLIQLCRKSRKEISGIMNTCVKDENVFITDIKLEENDVIESANSHEIIYNNKEYITKVIYELAFFNSSVYIRFHTHPTIASTTNMSNADINLLEYVQSLTDKVHKINSNSSTKVVEVIITNSEIAFYTYDLDSKNLIKLPLFVDGVKKVPNIEKSKFQIFKDGFLEGRRRLNR